ARWSGCGLGPRRAKHLRDAGGGRDLLLRWRFRRGRRLEILNVPPPVAFRPLAAATARALRVAERQPHLERKIGAPEVGEDGAVGTNDHSHPPFPPTHNLYTYLHQ